MLSAQHAGITINYDEESNRWLYVIDGRERSSESLQLAKEAIVKPRPKKRKPFAPVEAWYQNRWNGAWHKVIITAVAEQSSYGGPGVWIRDGKARKKEPARHLYPVGDKNDALIAELVRLEKNIESLLEEKHAVHEKLTSYRTPPNAEE